MKFKDGTSMYKTLDDVFHAGSEYWRTVDLPALTVLRDSEGLLWSLSNRRLAVLKMMQALTAETIWVKCDVVAYDPKFRRAKSTANDGIGIRPNHSANRT